MEALSTYPWIKLNRDFKLAGGIKPDVAEIAQPTIDLYSLNRKFKVKATTVDLTAAAGTYVAVLWADDGKRLLIRTVYKGASTGTTAQACFAEENGAVGQLTSLSASAQITNHGFEIDEGSFGFLCSGNPADSAVAYTIVYEEVAPA